ncbi:ABC transporter substrate-binding protein [Streptomyces brasiliensis]|uniref:Branched-chain amino acid ABC transporter substrate-binding protein n=1 Tax=Streptomyces brasiliensis TaxID=1954 RepID=A0A917P7N5_9ACTN|nr:ABC transporter substrate-binding protein [Streptomyces brasiliensis]GGJ65646.1 branched-chain amino acid ABC transporter substrate-binding protein [Streptomyces brasiliensis]
MVKRSMQWGIAAAAVSVALTGCAGGASGSTANADGVKIDYGVKDKELTIGVVSDLSGPFSAQGQSMVAGNQIYFNERNTGDKICGYTVKLDVQDHGYDVQKAQTAFNGMEPKVLAVTQLLGSPQIGALAPAMTNSETTTILSGWSSAGLASADQPNNAYYAVVGTTLPVAVIDGLSYLAQQGAIKDGNPIGHIHLTGDMGDNALKGSKAYAKKHNLKLTDIEVTGQEVDLTSQLAKLKRAGVKAVLVTAPPKTTGQLAAAMQAARMDLPILASAPAYSPTLVDASSPTKDFIERHLLATTPLVPFGDDTETSAKVAKEFDEGKKSGLIAGSAVANQEVNYGYAMSVVLGDALDAACKAGDLTRAGLHKALGTLDHVTTGVTVDLDYTDRSRTPSTKAYIVKPDGSAVGGGKLVTEVSSDEATTFQD